MSQSRCCVVCSRSSPKTIFSCRYKVHHRNVDVLRSFFKRDLDFGELCDRCYRLWYKHKRAKKEISPETVDSLKRTPRTVRPKSAPTFPTAHDTERQSEGHNGSYSKSTLSNNDADSNDSTEWKCLQGDMEDIEDDSSDYESIESSINFSDPRPALNNGLESSTTRKARSPDQLRNNTSVQNNSNISIEDFLLAVKNVAKSRKSKRKPNPYRSPRKVDPLQEHFADTQHQKLFTSNFGGRATAFDFLYSVPNSVQMKNVSDDVEVVV
ncbi:hypothetical protein AKO1_004925 [Acrasis kona]|uniref:Uncharacterized protein n=1 Tax=Acrasis kona TaxID=1008807 RepID=A0AAW2Z5A3_9EUKA